MRNWKSWALALGLLSLAVGSVASLPAGGKKEKEPAGSEKVDRSKVKASADADAVTTLQTGFELANFGRKAKMPEALVVAARILNSVKVKEGKAEKIEGKDVDKDMTKAGNLKAEALALLDEAAKMTEEDSVQSLIKATRDMVREGSRSPAPGQPRYFRGTLAPKESRNFRITVTAGLTRAFVRSNAGRDLDLTVIGALTGRQMVEDRGISPDASGEFHSPLPGIFDFTVINYSNDFAPFEMWIN